MKRIMKKIAFVGCLFFLVPTIYAGDWFVKVNGNGNGTSWDNALSGEQLIAKIEDGSVADGDVVYMAAGRYLTGIASSDVLTFSQNVEIKGGYDPESTGTNTDISYPSIYETIFSGDLNNNGIPDEGDCRVLEIRTAKTIGLLGITITNGYKNTNIADRPGIHADGGAVVNLDYCKVIKNQCELQTPTGNTGGAGIFIGNATVNCHKTIISGNKAHNRGGAIRMANNNGVLVLNACLLTDNSVPTNNYGGAVQLSSAKAFYCINTTITGNTANKGGAAINGGSKMYVVSSTIVDNYCVDGSQGHDIRVESPANTAYIINSIVTGGDAERITAATPNIFVNGTDKSITSAGNNVVGMTGGTGTFENHATDATGKYYADIFGDNSLAENDGYPQTIALADNIFSRMELVSLESFKASHSLPDDINLTIDQRGKVRESATAPGACEKVSAQTSVPACEAVFPTYTIYPVKIADYTTVSRAEGKEIVLYDLFGKRMYRIEKANAFEYIDTSSYPKGMYILAIGKSMTKLIK